MKNSLLTVIQDGGVGLDTQSELKIVQYECIRKLTAFIFDLQSSSAASVTLIAFKTCRNRRSIKK